MTKLLSFQPVSLYRNGGASRLLRRLYAGHESDVHSIGLSEHTLPVLAGKISETIVTAEPIYRPWMRWKLRNLVIWLREKVLRRYTIKKIQKAASNVDYDVLHLVSHGPYTMAAYSQSVIRGKQLWTSFHDHFITTSTSLSETKLLWQESARRLVISRELGQEYTRLFGNYPYEILTDGVLPEEISNPNELNCQKSLNIYFSGLLHIGYYPLFEVLADALDHLTETGINFNLIMRGTQQLPFLNNRKFVTEYRSNFVSDEAIKKEMDTASILYLPIKFNDSDFYRYSLSTKMVGYLGAPGAILYHGPADSAANRLLSEAQAAVNCTTLKGEDMMMAITQLISDGIKTSVNAKKLARQKFDMVQIRKDFWQQQ